MKLPPYWFVFDVESIGLHGEAFAVAYVVLDQNGVEVDYELLACSPEKALGRHSNFEWVKNNIPPIPISSPCPEGIKTDFWQAWLRWKKNGAWMIADCAWPVEARFLAACVDATPDANEWGGPYPLHELATILAVCGLDPTESHRPAPEGERHNPLSDAQASAQLLLECITKIHNPNTPTHEKEIR